MRRVLVTGASRGLGLAIAERLAADGFHVTALARGSSPALETAMESARKGPGALGFQAFDLMQLDDIAAMVRALKQAQGGFYGLVNNAGIGPAGLLTNMSQAEIERTVRLNTLAPMLLAKYVVRQMMIAREGRVVNIASIVAATGFNGLAAYGASKASMIGFTRSLARELGRVGVTVNAVAPGFVETDLTSGMQGEDLSRIAARSALGRLAEPSDVAAAVAFLMSEGARNITGTTLTVDAGGTA